MGLMVASFQDMDICLDTVFPDRSDLAPGRLSVAIVYEMSAEVKWLIWSTIGHVVILPIEEIAAGTCVLSSIRDRSHMHQGVPVEAMIEKLLA